MKFLFFICISLLSLTVWSQEELADPPPPEKMVQEPEIFVIVEEQAEFPGGMGEYLKYIEANLVYPKAAAEMHIEGRCYVSIVVEMDGSITNVKVVRGVPDCPECDKEAIRLMKAMPKWKPGKTGGKVVRSRVNLPMKFR